MSVGAHQPQAIAELLGMQGSSAMCQITDGREIALLYFETDNKIEQHESNSDQVCSLQKSCISWQSVLSPILKQKCKSMQDQQVNPQLTDQKR